MVRGYIAIISSMLIWGSVGVFARKAAQDPLIAVTYRLLVGAAVLLVYALWTRITTGKASEPSAEHGPGWAVIALSGVALAFNWLFFFKAIDTTTVSNAVLSYYTAPVFVALASPFILRERLEPRTILATALAFGGVFYMLYQPGQSLSNSDLLGISYGLLAACFYAAVTLMGRWFGNVPTSLVVLVQCLSAAAILLPVVWQKFGGAALNVPLYAVTLLAIVGVVHTAFALFLYFWGLKRVKVQHVGVLAYLDPMSAVLFAFIFLNEQPTPASLVGGALVLGGSALLLRRS